MRITNIKAQLTGEDILSILKDYVKVEDLTFEEIELKELIIVYGSYKKGVRIPFKIELGIGNIHENNVNIIIMGVKVARIGIIKGLKNLIIKKIMQAFPIDGITTNKDTFTVDMKIIEKFIPYVDFNLKALQIKEGKIEAELDELTYSDSKKAEDIFSKKKIEDKSITKKTDDYTKIRKNIKNKVPDKYLDIVEYVLLIPDIAALFVRLIKDKRVGSGTKALLVAVVIYIFSPIDALIDLIPFVGEVDDMVAVFFALNKVVSDIPEKIILENWQGKDDILLITKKGINFINNTLGAENISRVVRAIKKKHISKETENRIQ